MSNATNPIYNLEFTTKLGKILDIIALNIAMSIRWSEMSRSSNDFSDIESQKFLSQAFGNSQILDGTWASPIGNPLVKFYGIPLPQQIIDEINKIEYWPEWSSIYKEKLKLQQN